MSIVDGLQLGFGRRLPMILQSEAAECGLACLLMVAGYHGHRAELSTMRRQYGFSMRGMTMMELVDVANQFGMISRPVRLELSELDQLQMPCILHWDLNHFVVLKKVSGGDAVLHDPSDGIRRISLKELSNHFTGVALELTPSSDFKKRDAEPATKITSVLGRLIGVKSAMSKLLMLALALEVMTIIMPLLMQWVVDHALVSANFDLLTTLVIGFILVTVVQIGLKLMQGIMLMGFSASLTVQSRSGLFTHLLRLPAGFFDSRHMGDVMSRFDSQDQILDGITNDLLETVLDGLMVGLTLFIMFLYSPKLTMVVLITAILYGLLRWGLYQPQRNATAEAIVWNARLDSHFLETLRGIRTIKLFNGLNSRMVHWSSLLVNATNRKLAEERIGLVYETFQALVMGLAKIIVIWLGALAVLANTLSVGMLLAFIAYMDQFLDRVTALINRFVELRMLRLHAERLGDIALTEPEPQPTLFQPVKLKQKVAVEAQDLTFRYSDADPNIIDRLNFRVMPGESVAIAGASGCGKTTLLKILASLLEPTAGEILIDGNPISRLGVEQYRDNIGVVMQDDKLFSGSIYDNIAFFAQNPEYEWAEVCARLAGVHDEITGMAMGYQTLIGDMGTILSGGQQQRLLIARALYRRPRLLLLDEATSFLDVRKEREVNNAIASMDITRIMVAHRPQTLESADRVINLGEQGVIQDLELLSASAGRIGH